MRPTPLILRAAALADKAWPLADLLIRFWLAQLFWVQGIAGLGDWHMALRDTPGLAGALGMNPHPVAIGLLAGRLLLPAFLLTGFATRLACLPLLLLSVAGWRAAPAQDAALLWALLTGWYVVVGAGPASMDRLIARGIYRAALPWAPQAGRLAAALTRLARPVALLALRCLVAFVLVRHGMVVGGAGLVLPALLCAGLATRPACLPLLAVSGMAAMGGMTNEHFCWTLVLLLILANGPGVLSVDALVGLLAVRWGMRPALAADRLHHVVIVGGGFGGVAAAQSLKDAPCQVTLVDRHNYHLFQPLLYQVATASLSPADIATPIRALFRAQPNVRVVLGRVTGVDTATRTLLLAEGLGVAYDTLVLATGARHAYFGHDDWEDAAPGLKTLDDATAVRRRILLAFERAETTEDAAKRAALLTFAVIGGGPTGVELAGAIVELARLGLRQEFRRADPAQARVLLIQAGERVLPTFPPALSARAAASLAALGVEVRLGPAVEFVDKAGIVVGGERIACATVFWAAGVMASEAASWVGAPADRAGRLMVEGDLTVGGHPEIFAIGDTAASNGWAGKPVPGLAPAAKQQGTYVGRVIRARLARRAASAAFAYRHAGSLATIGRRAAVADFGRVRIGGPLAWWLWGVVHILFLAGARNRLVVGVQWFWAYLTFGRGIRLITGGR